MDLDDGVGAVRLERHAHQLRVRTQCDFVQVQMKEGMSIEKYFHFSKASSNSSGSGSKNAGGTSNFPRAEPGVRLEDGGLIGIRRATGSP
jgi:hypothetical protein